MKNTITNTDGNSVIPQLVRFWRCLSSYINRGKNFLYLCWDELDRTAGFHSTVLLSWRQVHVQIHWQNRCRIKHFGIIPVKFYAMPTCGVDWGWKMMTEISDLTVDSVRPQTFAIFDRPCVYTRRLLGSLRVCRLSVCHAPFTMLKR
jgi:hypothetical protein